MVDEYALAFLGLVVCECVGSRIFEDYAYSLTRSLPR
jgi:hypothetical protein